VAAIDDNVGRLMDYLDAHSLAENTIVVYASDQGFFLGDHGWFDKRFMYEESLRMPFVIRYPREIQPETVNKDMILNLDFAETFLDYAGVDIPDRMQGRSFRPLLNGRTPDDWRTSMYYRYWAHGGHNVYAHYGVRTHHHKLIYYYADPMGVDGAIGEAQPREWEMFDLRADPCELFSIYDDENHADVREQLRDELHRLQAECGDEPYPKEE